MSYYDDLPSDAVLRRFALFVDGVARAMMLPFGPQLVYRLVNDSAEVTPSSWASISFRFGVVIAAFMVGHSVGRVIGDWFDVTRFKRHRFVARLGGVAFALHIFSCGAGLHRVFWLATLRFLSAMVVGILCELTDASSLPEDATIMSIDTTSVTSFNKQVDPRSDIASGTAKIYLAGFALSMFTGGVFYRPATADELLQNLTGSYSYAISILFWVAMAVACEMVLRGFFACTIPGRGNLRVSFRGVDTQIDLENLRLLGSPGGARRRSRTDSAISAISDADEFFDCQSQNSDNQGGNRLSINSTTNDNEHEHEDEVAQYINRKCCYADKSPAYVPPGNSVSVVPANYLKNCKGDEVNAMKMWKETQEWRKENEVWKVHTIPNKFFHDIKKAYPHFAHGHSKEGYPVMYEMTGQMKLKELFGGECTIEDMVHHYIFSQEAFSNHLCANEELRKIRGESLTEPYKCENYGLFVVMDIKGAGISALSGDILRYLARSGDIVGKHYPYSVRHCCVVNVPWFAGGAYKTIQSMLPDSVVLELYSEADSKDALLKYIDSDQIPKEFGGTSPYEFDKHPNELKIKDLVEQAAKGDFDEEEGGAVSSDLSDDNKEPEAPESMTDVTLNDVPEDAPTPPRESSLRSSTDQRMRRRTAAGSPDAPDVSFADDTKLGNPVDRVGVDSNALLSFFCAFWGGAQGGIELAIPLWLCSPVRFGGLGYSPAMNGTIMFVAALTGFGMLNTRAARLVSNMPRNNPLRAMRIGLGGESIVLFSLALVPIKYSPSENSVTTFILTAVLLAFGAFASILGHSSSIVLRGIASDGFAQQVDAPSSNAMNSLESLWNEMSSGRAVDLLSSLGQIAGVFVNAGLWALSLDREKPSQYDGSFCLFLPAFWTLCLYFVTNFLRVKGRF